VRAHEFDSVIFSSLSDLKEIGSKITWPVHISPLFGANGTTIGLKIVKICPRPCYFSLRFFKPDRLLINRQPSQIRRHSPFPAEDAWQYNT